MNRRRGIAVLAAFAGALLILPISSAQPVPEGPPATLEPAGTDEDIPPPDPSPAEEPAPDDGAAAAEPGAEEEGTLSRTSDETRARLRELAPKQAAWKSLAAAYAISDLPNGRSEPIVETGTVRMRFTPERPPEERWEGRDETGGILRIVRDGAVHLWRDGKAAGSFSTSDPKRLGPAFLRFPRLPADWDALFIVLPTEEPRGRGTGIAPMSFAFWPADDARPSPSLRVFYLEFDADTGLAYRLNWLDWDGPQATVELFDEKPGAPVTDADFTAPEAKTGDDSRKNGQPPTTNGQQTPNSQRPTAQ